MVKEGFDNRRRCKESTALKLLKPVVIRSRETKEGDWRNLGIVGIVLSLILVFGIVGIGLGSAMLSTHYPTKSAICTSKVLGLAQKGIIRDVGGYNNAIYECTHTHGFSSIYGSL
jgi:hypothetical protein